MSHLEMHALTVSWSENRNGELFLMFATKERGRWDVWERSTFEVRYFPAEANALRVATAEALMQKRIEKEASL